MRKRLLFVLLSTTMLLGMVGCGKDNQEKNKDNNVNKEQSEDKIVEDDVVEGDGSLIPQKITIDGIEYKKYAKVSEFLDNGWMIEGYQGTDIITDNTSFTLNKDNNFLEISTENNESNLELKELKIVDIGVNTIVTDVEFVLSNGVSLDGHKDIIYSVYSTVENELQTQNVNAAVKMKNIYYGNEEGFVSIGHYAEEENKNEIVSISVGWFK